MGCANPSVNNKLQQEVIDSNTLWPGTFKKKEVISTNISTEADSLYNVNIIRYADSLDSKINTLKKVKKNLDVSSEGGEAVLYLSGKDTLKINITFYREMGKSVYVLYLRNSYPVFYIGTTFFYKEPIYISKDVKIDSTTVDKIVLRNNNVISWLQNGGEITKKYEEKEQEVRELYSEIQTFIR